jgi:hypothetical protein
MLACTRSPVGGGGGIDPNHATQQKSLVFFSFIVPYGLHEIIGIEMCVVWGSESVIDYAASFSIG